MPALKFSAFNYLYGNPCMLNKWLRSLGSPTASVPLPVAVGTGDCFRSIMSGQRLSAPWLGDSRVLPSASVFSPAEDEMFRRKFGFRSQKYCCSFDDKGAAVSSVDSGNDEPLNGNVSAFSQLPLQSNHEPRVIPPSVTPPSQQTDSAKLLTLPTMLTIARVAAVPVLVGTFYVDSWWGTTATTGIFIAASFTDWLDGYIARKKNLGTAFGAFLDPVADKLMVAATLVLLCTRPWEVPLFGQASWILTIPSIAIIGREITMSAVREWAASQNNILSEAVAVNNLGKWKTATQMTALTILLATRDSSLAGAGTLVVTGVGLLYISAWLALWSLFVYMRKIWKVMLM